MLTATEVVFIKDLIGQLMEAMYDGEHPAKYDLEVEQALELLNKIEPISDEKVLNMLDDTAEEE